MRTSEWVRKKTGEIHLCVRERARQLCHMISILKTFLDWVFFTTAWLQRNRKIAYQLFSPQTLHNKMMMTLIQLNESKLVCLILSSTDNLADDFQTKLLARACVYIERMFYGNKSRQWCVYEGEREVRENKINN